MGITTLIFGLLVLWALLMAGGLVYVSGKFADSDPEDIDEADPADVEWPLAWDDGDLGDQAMAVVEELELRRESGEHCVSGFLAEMDRLCRARDELLFHSVSYYFLACEEDLEQEYDGYYTRVCEMHEGFV